MNDKEFIILLQSVMLDVLLTLEGGDLLCEVTAARKLREAILLKRVPLSDETIPLLGVI